MKNFNYFLSFLIFNCSFFVLNAQDIHFSQFNETPALVNPALTGVNNALRASLIYKDQWRSVTVPYKTYGASIEMRLKGSNWNKVGNKTAIYKKAYDRLAGGISFFSDKAGDGNMGSTQVNLTLASYVPVSKNSSVSLGLQGGIVQRKIDFTKLIFPDQYNGTGYDPNINPGENYSANNFIYPDFAAGLLWNYANNEKSIGANNQFKANAGVSVYHINQPKQKFLTQTNELLNAKLVVHGSFLIGIQNSNVAIAPNYLFQMQGVSSEFIAGMMVKYYFSENSKYTGLKQKSAIGIGANYRNRDAVIFTGQIEYQRYAIGVSYDLNTSKLKTASTGRGGLEVFIRVVTPNPFLYENKSRF